MFLKNKLTWLCIGILVSVEQLIKVIINTFYLKTNVAILPPFLYFSPVFNRYYSWFNSMLQISSSKWIHIVFVAVMTALILLFYRYLLINYSVSRYLNVMFAFLISGTTCSLMDKVIWNGSLDYILLNGFFTFDLKDIYIDIFIALMILSLLIKKDIYKPFADKNVVKDFFRFTFYKK